MTNTQKIALAGAIALVTTGAITYAGVKIGQKNGGHPWIGGLLSFFFVAPLANGPIVYGIAGDAMREETARIAAERRRQVQEGIDLMNRANSPNNTGINSLTAQRP